MSLQWPKEQHATDTDTDTDTASGKFHEILLQLEAIPIWLEIILILTF